MDPATKSDEFLEKCQRGGGHFQSKNIYCRLRIAQNNCFAEDNEEEEGLKVGNVDK